MLTHLYKTGLLFALLTYSSLIYAFDDCKARAISIGWGNWPPYQILQNGHVSGLDKTYLDRLFATLNCKTTYKELAWHEQLQALKTGSIDFATAAYKTPLRAKYAHFSIPYRKDQIVLAMLRTPKTEKLGDTTLKHILDNGMLIGAVHGHHYGPEYDKLLHDKKYKRRFLLVKTAEENLQQLFTSRVQAILIDPNVLAHTTQHMQVKSQLLEKPPVIYEDVVHIIASKKTVSETFMKALNDAILLLEKNPEKAS